MRFATFAQTVLAVSSLVSATPIEKRAFVTDVDYVTDLSIVTTTVGGNTVNQTPASQQHHHSLPEKFRHKAVQHNHHAAKPNFQQAQSQVWTSIVTGQPSQTQTQAQQQQLSTATATQAGPQKQNLVHSHDGEKVWAWTRVFPEHPVTKSAQQATTTPTPSTASSASPSPSSSSSPTSASSSATPSSSSSSSSATNTYQKNVLDSHNIHRSNHSVSALTWSDDLESSALVLAQSCVYGHNV
ncbi:hypothetical protein KEM55_006414 [Ascosphaera atra]|nr:hypothetical protein KEM55_006414 [Ascosphaera atra]